VTLDVSQELGDPPAPGAATPVAEGTADAAPRHHATTMRAVARDLRRLQVTLAEPVTAVRREALVAHIGFLVEQARAGDGQHRPAGALSRLRHESRLWSRDPLRRSAVRTAADVAVAALGPVRVGAPGDPGPPGRFAVRLRELPWRRPTALAYRHFWLLDDLPPHLVDEVTADLSRPAGWALRNVLSGGYNRRAYLMWIGGGSGPAV